MSLDRDGRLLHERGPEDVVNGLRKLAIAVFDPPHLRTIALTYCAEHRLHFPGACPRCSLRITEG
jgi:hypothetical protein